MPTLNGIPPLARLARLGIQSICMTLCACDSPGAYDAEREELNVTFRQIDTLVDSFHKLHGRYPDDSKSLYDQLSQWLPEGYPFCQDRSGRRSFIDPWGSPILYDASGPYLRSSGRNKILEGYAGDDISFKVR